MTRARLHVGGHRVVRRRRRPAGRAAAHGCSRSARGRRRRHRPVRDRRLAARRPQVPRPRRTPLASTARRVQTYELCMRAADGVICSTDWLAQRYRSVNPRTWTAATASTSCATRSRVPQRDHVGIGWAGGTGHSASAKPWIEEVGRVMRERPAGALHRASASRSRTGSSRSSAPSAPARAVRGDRGLPGRDDAASTSRSRPPARATSSAARATCAGSRPPRCGMPWSPIRTSTRRSSTASPASTRRRPPRCASTSASWSPIASCASASAPPPRRTWPSTARAQVAAAELGRRAPRGRRSPLAVAA